MISRRIDGSTDQRIDGVKIVESWRAGERWWRQRLLGSFDQGREDVSLFCALVGFDMKSSRSKRNSNIEECQGQGLHAQE